MYWAQRSSRASSDPTGVAVRWAGSSFGSTCAGGTGGAFTDLLMRAVRAACAHAVPCVRRLARGEQARTANARRFGPADQTTDQTTERAGGPAATRAPKGQH